MAGEENHLLEAGVCIVEREQSKAKKGLAKRAKGKVKFEV
jgi:hypothetical protein